MYKFCYLNALFSILVSVYAVGKWLGHMVIYVCLFEKQLLCFPQKLYHFTFPTSKVQRLQCLYILVNFYWNWDILISVATMEIIVSPSSDFAISALCGLLCSESSSYFLWCLYSLHMWLLKSPVPLHWWSTRDLTQISWNTWSNKQTTTTTTKPPFCLCRFPPDLNTISLLSQAVYNSVLSFTFYRFPQVSLSSPLFPRIFNLSTAYPVTLFSWWLWMIHLLKSFWPWSSSAQFTFVLWTSPTLPFSEMSLLVFVIFHWTQSPLPMLLCTLIYTISSNC